MFGIRLSLHASNVAKSLYVLLVAVLQVFGPLDMCLPQTSNLVQLLQRRSLLHKTQRFAENAPDSAFATPAALLQTLIFATLIGIGLRANKFIPCT